MDICPLTNSPSWRTTNDCHRGDIFGNNGAGAYDGTSAKSYTRQNDRLSEDYDV